MKGFFHHAGTSPAVRLLSLMLVATLLCGFGIFSAIGYEGDDSTVASKQDASVVLDEADVPAEEPAEETAEEPAEEAVEEPAEDSAEPEETASAVEEAAEEAPLVEEDASVPEDAEVEDSSAAEEGTDAEAEPEEEADPVAYPAQSFVGGANSVTVTVNAPEGALPAGTSMVVSPVAASAVMDDVEAAVDGEVKSVRAVDISFYAADGTPVEPLCNINVTLTSSLIASADSASVVHIPDAGQAEVVAEGGGSSQITFASDEFSIYVVVETGEDARLNVNFVQADGSTTVTETINKRQLDMVNTYIYDPGVGTLPEGTMFNGWTTDPNYTSETTPKTIADVRTDAAAKLGEAGFTDGTTITYYAMVFKPYSVIYQDERGKVITTDVVLARVEDDAPTHTITRDYTPYPPEEDGVAATFKGWQQLEPVVPGTEVIYQVNESFTMAQTTYKLRAKVEQGHWLAFDENLSNATYTEPLFVPTGSTPASVQPAPTPTCAGYSLEGWYTEDASSARDGKAAGSAFNFNQELEENTTIYGNWTEATRAPYTVIIWKQRVTGSGYDFAESVQLNGNVGTTINTVTQTGSNVNTGTTPTQTRNIVVNGTQKAYTGFHCASFDQNVTIKADGTTVLNVYYDRNTITINFDAGNSSYILDENDNTYKRYVTYTGLYEAPLSFTWPTTYYTNNSGGGGRPTLWHYGNTTLTMIGDFKLPTNTDVTLSLTRADTDDTPIRFYQMDINGSYSNTPKDTIYAGNGQFTLTNKYTGFELDTYRRNGTGSWNTATDGGTVASGYNQLEIRYKRVQKPITYLDGVYVTGGGTPTGQTSRGQLNQTAPMYFGTNVSSYGKGGANYYTPEFDGYVFLGWYADATCTSEYKFETMPVDGITVYAKWGVAEYEVNLVANDSTDDPIKYTQESQSTKFWVDDGEKIGNVGGERIYYDLVGWYTDAGFTHPFNFDAYRINEQTVGHYGKLYSASEIDPDYPTTIGEIILYAKWRSKLIGADGIDVVYIPGDGTCGSDTNKYADQSDAVAIGAAIPTDTNYVFSHWEVQKWNGSDWELDTKVFPGDPFDVLAANAKIVDTETDEVVALKDLEKDGKYTYTIQVNAVYVEKDKETLTFINWYYNYAGKTDPYSTSTDIKINQAVDVPAAPTRTGYKFLGWIKGIEEDGPTTELTDLYITYDNGAYSTDVANALIPVQVAADENLVGDGTQHNALYAKWEPADVKYTVEYYYMNDDGTYPTTATSSDATRTAKTESTVEVTAADKTPSGEKYALDSDNTSNIWSAKVAADGSTVLKVYFKLNKADVTVHHYLKGTTTKVSDDVTESATIGTEYTAEPVTTYQGKNLTVDSYNPSQKVTVSVGGNVITIYYTLPLTITAKTDSKMYDGTPLNGEYTVDGALDSDSTVITTALGTAPSITLVSESPKQYQASTDGIPGYYTITNTPGTLTITQNTKTITVTSPDADKKYDGTPLTKDGAEATNLPEGHKLEAVVIGNITNAGETPNTIGSIKILDAKGNDVTDQFANIEKKEGTLTVTKLKVTLTSADDEKAYDGTPLTNDTVTVTGDKLPDGESFEFDVTGSQTYVGSSPNEFTYKLVKADSTTAPLKEATRMLSSMITATQLNAGPEDNYEITKVEGTLTVTDDVDNKDVITKSHDGKKYDIGETVTFNIEVTNIYDEAKDITITEIEGVTLSQDKFTAVEPGKTVTATATYTITEADAEAGTFKNTATAKFSGVDKDYPAEDEVNVNDPKPHLTLTKTTTSTPANGSTYALGETITYKVTVHNDGNVTLKNVEVTDELTGNTWKIDSIEPGEVVNVDPAPKYTVTEEDILKGSVTNAVTATADDDPEVVPDEVTDETDKPNGHLTITKDTTSSPKNGKFYTKDETVKYSITVVNDGNLTITDIKVSDDLTGESWTVKSLAPGEKQTFETSYKITEDDVKKGSVTNNATGKGTSPDPNKPDVPVTPGTKTVPTGEMETPDTGDTTPIIPLAIAMMASLCGITFMASQRRRAR